MDKKKLKNQLSELGIQVHGNHVHKKDIKKVINATDKTYIFHIGDDGDPSVGEDAWEDTITISFENMPAPQGFDKEMRAFLEKYFDCPCVTEKELQDSHYEL